MPTYKDPMFSGTIYKTCPACSNETFKTYAPATRECDKCGALYGFCTIEMFDTMFGTDLRHFSNIPDEPSRYFDITYYKPYTPYETKPERFHGWYGLTSGKLVQVG